MIWNTIPEFPKYLISKEGLVKKLSGDLLKVTFQKYGSVKLKHESGIWKRVYVHRLVMRAFVGLRPEGYVINHIDGNKSNNSLDNLEYCTQTENERHSINVLGKTHTRDSNGRFTRASSS